VQRQVEYGKFANIAFFKILGLQILRTIRVRKVRKSTTQTNNCVGSLMLALKQNTILKTSVKLMLEFEKSIHCVSLKTKFLWEKVEELT
jgi:hypothetical protein